MEPKHSTAVLTASKWMTDASAQSENTIKFKWNPVNMCIERRTPLPTPSGLLKEVLSLSCFSETDLHASPKMSLAYNPCRRQNSGPCELQWMVLHFMMTIGDTMWKTEDRDIRGKDCGWGSGELDYRIWKCYASQIHADTLQLAQTTFWEITFELPVGREQLFET